MRIDLIYGAKFKLVFVLLALCAVNGMASSKNEIGLGYTSNANLERVEKDSDLFMKIGTFNRFEDAGGELGFRLNFKDYFRENHNDVLSWGIFKDLTKTKIWTVSGEFFGQQYPGGTGAATDSSFDHFGFELRGLRSLMEYSSSYIDLEPGVQLFKFTNIDTRTDTNLYGRLLYHNDLSGSKALELFSELGWTLSTTSEYSKYYLELGVEIDVKFHESLSWVNELIYRQQHYYNRMLSQSTTSIQRRGQVVTSVEETKEVYSSLQFTSSVRKELQRSLDAGFEFQYISQTSLSGWADYTAVILLAKLIFNF